MKADLLITNIGQVVTCSSGGKPKRGLSMQDPGILENGVIAINEGKIAAVGSSDDIWREFECENVVDAGGNVVCPGFVDPHTHIVYAGDRLDEFELKIGGADYLEILASGGGIISTVRHTREASLEELVGHSMKRLDKMLKCGTTTAEIKTGYGLDIETELKMLRAIEQLDQDHSISLVPTLLAAHAVPPEFKDNADAYVDLICDEMLAQAWQLYEDSHFPASGTPFFVDVFCEKNAFNADQSRRILSAAAGMGFGVKAHVDQFTNLGCSKLAIELGAVSIDHLDAISDDEISSLAAADTIGVVIPTENFSAAKTVFADARRMIDAGCAIALSTDFNPGSAPCPSQPMAMAIACRYQRLLPSEAINAATINAAHALGLGDRVGSLEAGKRSDLLILDTRDYREIAYEFGGNLISGVYKAGVRIV